MLITGDNPPAPEPIRFSGYTAIAAEGERIGLVTCLECGAAVQLDPAVDMLLLHARWHGAKGYATGQEA